MRPLHRPAIPPLVAAVACALLAPSVRAQNFDGDFGVNTAYNIWVAGRTPLDLPAAGGGLFPVWIDLPRGQGRLLRLDITGTFSYGPTVPSNGPDGAAAAPCTIPAFNNLSGITTSAIRAVTGVMLGDGPPTAPAPAPLSFSNAGFVTLAPALQQTFFIGDGHQGIDTPGAPQHIFAIPDDATRLYLGFMDFFNCGEPPAGYADNSGAGIVHFSITFACIGVESLSPFTGSCPMNGAQCTIQLRGPGEPHYQWQRETAPNVWTDLVSGATPAGSVISSADQPTLAVAPVTPADFGRYRCFITTPCGNIASEPTPLHLQCASNADIGSAGGTPSCDGLLNNNDFVVFIQHFFTNNPIADVGRQGGIAPGDGQFNNNDFIVFIDQFFAGC